MQSELQVEETDGQTDRQKVIFSLMIEPFVLNCYGKKALNKKLFSSKQLLLTS